MQVTPAARPRPSASSRSPLTYLGPQWFLPVMGWCGLALAWDAAVPRFGEPARFLALGSGLIALVIFLVVGAASAVRAWRHGEALSEDLAHPVRHAFVAALPASILLLATVGTALYGPGDALGLAWLLGAALQFAATVRITGAWLGGQLKWARITPALQVVATGNLLAPLAGAQLDWPATAWLLFGIGAFLWPVITVMTLVRQAQQPLPDRLQVTWFLGIAPAAVLGVAAPALDAPLPIALAALGVASLAAATCLLRVPTIVHQPLSMTTWSTAFPMAALAMLALDTAEAGLPGLDFPAAVLLAAASAVLVGLSLTTYRGLRAGTLLAPEPVATIAVSKDSGQ